MQLKQDAVGNNQRTLEEQKRRLTEASDKLAKENQKLSAVVKAIEELRKKQATENTALKTIDIENDSLVESIEQTGAEIASLDSQLEAVRNQIADVQSKLKDATDRAPLEDRLKDLRTKETDLAASLKKQKDSLAKDKAARNALIGKKADTRLRLVDIDNETTQKADEQTAIQQAVGAAAKEEQTATATIDTLSRGLDKTKLELATAKAETERLYGIGDKLDERWQDLDGLQDLLAKKGPFLSTVLISVNASLRIVQDEALPKTQTRRTDSKLAVADLNAQHQQLLAESRNLQREKTDAAASLTEFQRQSNMRNAELRGAEKVVSDTRNSLTAARQTLAGINSEVTSLRNSIAEREAVIAKNQASIKAAIDEIAKLDAQLLAQTKALNDAQAAEKLARDLWEPLEQAAVAAAKATEDGKALLANRMAGYQRALADVVQKAMRDAQDPAAAEGLAGEVPGATAGALAGETSWQQEGSSQLRATEFAKAFDVAKAAALTANANADIRETAVQQAERAAQPSLQSAFEAGNKRGRADGVKAGILLGDNSDAEKRGFDVGYTVGKQRVEAEMEQALLKVSYQEREVEILKDNPAVIEPTREKRDATKDQGARASSYNFFRVIASHCIGLLQESIAVAADGLGVLPLSQVPKVTFSGRKYQDSGLKPYHSDFPRVYRTAYDEAYGKAYVTSYLESYRSKFVKAHGDAFAAAKAKSLQDGFVDEARKGTQAGNKEGLFEACLLYTSDAADE